jgi:serine/threonine protein kinase
MPHPAFDQPEKEQWMDGGRLQLLKPLGYGGQSQVWLAKDPKLERYVAIKFPREKPNELAESIQLLEEAKTVAAIRGSKFLPKLYAYKVENSWPYVEFEYIEGETLEARLESESPLPWEEAVEVAIKIANALADIGKRHPNGALLHRDIKPANIMLCKGTVDRYRKPGDVVLLDFGISRTSWNPSDEKTGFTGTWGYAAPEQILEVEHKHPWSVDYFALGVTLYRMIAGRLPWKADDIKDANRNFDSRMQLLQQLFSCPPQRSDISDAPSDVQEKLWKVFAKCTAYTPAERYQNAESIAQDLNECLPSPQKTSLRRWLVLSVFFVWIALLLHGVVVWYTSQSFIEKLNGEIGKAIREHGGRSFPLEAERPADIVDFLSARTSLSTRDVLFVADQMAKTTGDPKFVVDVRPTQSAVTEGHFDQAARQFSIAAGLRKMGSAELHEVAGDFDRQSEWWERSIEEYQAAESSISRHRHSDRSRLAIKKAMALAMLGATCDPSRGNALLDDSVSILRKELEESRQRGDPEGSAYIQCWLAFALDEASRLKGDERAALFLQEACNVAEAALEHFQSHQNLRERMLTFNVWAKANLENMNRCGLNEEVLNGIIAECDRLEDSEELRLFPKAFPIVLGTAALAYQYKAVNAANGDSSEFPSKEGGVTIIRIFSHSEEPIDARSRQSVHELEMNCLAESKYRLEAARQLVSEAENPRLLASLSLNLASTLLHEVSLTAADDAVVKHELLAQARRHLMETRQVISPERFPRLHSRLKIISGMIYGEDARMADPGEKLTLLKHAQDEFAEARQLLTRESAPIEHELIVVLASNSRYQLAQLTNNVDEMRAAVEDLFYAQAIFADAGAPRLESLANVMIRLQKALAK